MTTEGPLSLRAFAFATDGSTGYVIGGFARAKGEPDIGKFTLTLRQGAERAMAHRVRHGQRELTAAGRVKERPVEVQSLQSAVIP